MVTHKEANHTNVLLFIFGLCCFLPTFIGRAIDLSLPTIGKEFDMTIIALSWIVTAYLLTSAVLLIPFGRLADLWGRRKIYLAGTILFTLSSLICTLAYSGKMLIAGRMIQGMASAMIFGTATAIAVALFPSRQRGRVLGILASCVFLGGSLGPSLGGIMTQYLGWRSIFIMTTLLSAIVAVMSFVYLKDEWIEAHGERFDFIGSILYGVSVIALLYGTTMLPAVKGYLTILAGLLCFIIFCVAEDYIHHPIFDVNLLIKNKAFAMANLAGLLNFSAAYATPFLMSLYLQYVKGMDPKTAGFIILASPITMVIGSPFTGKLSDKIDPRVVASLGMACTTIALIIMSIALNGTTPLPLLVGMLFMFGAGLSLFASPNTNAAMGAVSKKHLGIAASVLNTTRTFGQTMSMGISTLILTLCMGKVEISQETLPQLLTSAKVTLFVFGLLCLIGVFASLARGKRQ